ncbi:sensor histidine kinase [Actinopolymorpha pittospori]
MRRLTEWNSEWNRWWVRPPWRDPLVAVGQFVLGTLLYVAGLDTLSSPGGSAVPLWVRLVILGFACVGSLLRARRPVVALGIGTVALVIDVVLHASLPIVLVMCELLFASTLYGSRRLARFQVCVAAAIPLVTLAAGLALMADWREAVLLTLQIATVPVLPVWWAMNVRNHREMAAAERVRAEQLATIADLDLRAAVVAERARMARDLHDVVAGHLSAIALQSEAVLSMAGHDPATARTVLGSIRENSVQSLTEMRAMIGMLRADEGADPPREWTAPARLADLERLLDSARANGLRVEVDVARRDQAEAEPLPSAVDLTAYRIVQEALTNAATHAPGARTRVRLERRDDRFVVEVANDLLPRVRAEGDRRAERVGLVSMRERAQAIGGTLFAGPDPTGWLVHAELPTKGLVS